MSITENNEIDDEADVFSERIKSLADLKTSERNEHIMKLVDAGEFDYIDFGTHKGGGLTKGLSMGGNRGLGVDLSDKKVVALLRQGKAAYSGDILQFNPRGRPFKFAICRHVLEHMPNKFTVGVIISQLSKLCSDFIYIEQPSFDHTDYLLSKQLVASPTTLEYHTTRLTNIELFCLLRDLELTNFTMGGQVLYASSSHPKVFRADAAPNRMIWNAEQDAEKPQITLKPNVYQNVMALIALNNEIDTTALFHKCGGEKVQYISRY